MSTKKIKQSPFAYELGEMVDTKDGQLSCFEVISRTHTPHQITYGLGAPGNVTKWFADKLTLNNVPESQLVASVSKR